MGPHLDSCELTRGNLRVCGGSSSQALIDKSQIIEGYNHRTKQCCVLSQDDGTSSSDRRAIECPKVLFWHRVERLQQLPPKQPFRRDRRPAIPGIKLAKYPRQHPQADDPFVADYLLDTVAQRNLAKTPFRALRCRLLPGCTPRKARSRLLNLPG